MSDSEPHSRITGSAKTTANTLINAAAPRMNTRKVARIPLAPSLFPSPLRRATRADMDTLAAKKSASPTILGWVVSPTAATAEEPRELTIRESTSPAKAVKKDSNTAGQAMPTAFFTSSLG